MEIPKSWTDLVLAIRDVCPTAVLGGGALRDLDNDREVKDLDFFVRAETEGDCLKALEALREVYGAAIHFEPSELTYYPEDQNLEVLLVAEMLDHDLPIQLIFVRWDTTRIIDRFDYGICQLSYDGLCLTVGDHYEADKAAKVFRLRRVRPTPLAMRGSVKRYARLTAEKYPGWDWAAFEGDDEDTFVF